MPSKRMRHTSRRLRSPRGPSRRPPCLPKFAHSRPLSQRAIFRKPPLVGTPRRVAHTTLFELVESYFQAAGTYAEHPSGFPRRMIFAILSKQRVRSQKVTCKIVCLKFAFRGFFRVFEPQMPDFMSDGKTDTICCSGIVVDDFRTPETAVANRETLGGLASSKARYFRLQIAIPNKPDAKPAAQVENIDGKRTNAIVP